MNSDFKDLLQAFSEFEVEYLVADADAVMQSHSNFRNR